MGISSRKTAAAIAAAILSGSLLLAEGLAVGALIVGRIHLVGAHQDLVQRTVVLVAAVMGALLDGTFNTLVSMTIHRKTSFEIGFGNSMGIFRKIIQEKRSNVAKGLRLCYSLI